MQLLQLILLSDSLSSFAAIPFVGCRWYFESCTDLIQRFILLEVPVQSVDKCDKDFCTECRLKEGPSGVSPPTVLSEEASHVDILVSGGGQILCPPLPRVAYVAE